MFYNHVFIYEKLKKITERLADHFGKDKQSHLLRHALNSNHKAVDPKGFKIIDSSHYNSSKGTSQKPVY